jgi:hypothetical protein
MRRPKLLSIKDFLVRYFYKAFIMEEVSLEIKWHYTGV